MFDDCLIVYLFDFYSFNNPNQPLSKCRRVFRSMIRLAVEELCETADSLIAPVRLGVARPTAPFTLASSANDIINVSIYLSFISLSLIFW